MGVQFMLIMTLIARHWLNYCTDTESGTRALPVSLSEQELAVVLLLTADFSAAGTSVPVK